MVKSFKLSDQVIGQLRELLQLSMLTRTNIVDNFRTLELEESTDVPGKLILSEEYCLGWNKMVTKMQEDADKKHEKLQATVATDGSESDKEKPSRPETLITSPEEDEKAN